jgi:glycosyltransferase involved in cell wall biosynthesis
VKRVPDVVLPVLNEAEALPWVLSRIPASYRPIVVDNGSTDDSALIARRLGARVITEPVPGYGAACDAGLRAADDEIVCFMDCDRTLDPSSLPMMIKPISDNDADLVLGRRIPDRGAWPPHARVANALLAWRIRKISGADIHDVSPMRAARREMLLALGLTDRRCGLPLQILVEAARASWRIVEVPVRYHHRYGHSKVTGTLRGTAHTVADMWPLVR